MRDAAPNSKALDDAVAAARAARLRHVSDDSPGFSRRNRKAALITSIHGSLIGDVATLRRRSRVSTFSESSA